MTIHQIAVAIRARWRAVLLTFVLVAGLGAAVTAMLPDQYTATGSVVVDVKSNDPIDGEAFPVLAISSYMATQADILKSSRVGTAALKAMGVDKDPHYVANWRAKTKGRGDMLEWAWGDVLRHFEIVPARESNVLTIEYRDESPERAAALINAVIAAYVATTAELRSGPAAQFEVFFEQRAKRLRDALALAQSRLSAFQQSAGVLVTDEKVDVETTRLNQLASELVTAQSLAGASNTRQRMGSTNADRTPEVLASGLISGMMGDVAKLEAHIGELRVNHGDQYPDILQAQANIAQLRAHIAAETAKVTASLAVTGDVNSARVAQIERDIELQRTKLLDMKRQRDQAAVLERDVTNASQAYDDVSTKGNQNRLQNGPSPTNVSVLRLATTPGLPSRPRVLVNMAVACIFGALLAVFVGLRREAADPRLHTDDDVAITLRQPIFGVLPDGERGKRGRLRPLTPPRRPAPMLAHFQPKANSA